jgi:hypothetical protein
MDGVYIFEPDGENTINAGQERLWIIFQVFFVVFEDLFESLQLS